MKIKIADIILIIALFVGIVFLSLVLYIPKLFEQKSVKYYAVVKINNVIVEEIHYQDLTEEKEYVFKGRISYVTVHADSTGVWVIQSGCLDHDCINLGKYGDGDTNPIMPLACLPNALIIQIIAIENEEIS